MKILIEFDTENAAFDDQPDSELKNIFFHLKGDIVNYMKGWVPMSSGVQCDWIRDSNGNRIGTMKCDNR
jgi:hypothetical protein